MKSSTSVLLEIRVEALSVLAEIGALGTERGRMQELVVDIVATAKLPIMDRIENAVDYRALATCAHDIASEGHITLVETFAVRVAERCNAIAHVRQVAVTVRKPEALTPAIAAVHLVLESSSQ